MAGSWAVDNQRDLEPRLLPRARVRAVYRDDLDVAVNFMTDMVYSVLNPRIKA